MRPIDKRTDVVTAIILASVLTLCSLIQLVWTARIVRRISAAWSAMRPFPPLDALDSLGRIAPFFWAAGFLAATATYLEVFSRPKAELELVSLTFATMLW